MKKRLCALALSGTLLVSLLAGCGGGTGGTSATPSGGADPAPATTEPTAAPAGDTATGSVYYLNFKPEADSQWQDLAAAYTAETGVPVRVMTAASGQYETTLKSEMAKGDAPTLFQVNGPVGLASWRKYCYDLSGSDFYGELTNEAFALKEGSAVYGVAYAYEGYGIIVNTKLLSEAGYTVDDIKSFDQLKAVAEDITARSGELGFSAFTSAGMDGSSDWRFKTHLANMPLYYEYEDEGYEGTPDTIKGTYLDNYRALWDLYVNNATCAPSQLSVKTGDDAVADFVTEEAVFYQNGVWAYGDIAADVGDENLAIIPIYAGVKDQNQGLCIGTENYWCVNGKASPENIQATLDFIYWCVTSETGTSAMAGDMGFISPFKSAKETANVLNNKMNELVASGTYAVAWDFNYIPSEEWKNGVGSALTVYAADQSDANWDAVVTAFVDGWATEAAALKAKTQAQ